MSRDLEPIYRPGTSEILGHVPRANHGSNWAAARAALSELLVACEDDIDAPDLYFGGDDGDANRIDAVVVKGEILATYSPVTAEELAAIYFNPVNDHAKLGALIAAPLARAAE